MRDDAFGNAPTTIESSVSVHAALALVLVLYLVQVLLRQPPLLTERLMCPLEMVGLR